MLHPAAVASHGGRLRLRLALLCAVLAVAASSSSAENSNSAAPEPSPLLLYHRRAANTLAAMIHYRELQAAMGATLP